MNLTVDKALFGSMLDRFSPDSYAVERSLAFFSAALAIADNDLISKSIEIGSKNGVARDSYHEIVLQSYLFLGFPRMLEAAKILNQNIPLTDSEIPDLGPITNEESQKWFENGLNLCRQVYKDKYEPLRENVMSFAPDIFRWMIVEGYGKVLSRDNLDIKIRELAIISILMIENRPRQLHSHLLGAVNVGTESELINHVIEDIGKAAGEGYTTARNLLRQIGVES